MSSSWAPQFAIGSPIATVGYNQTTSPSASVDNNQTPALNLTNAFTPGILQPAGSSLGNLTGIGQSFSIVDPTAKSPYVQQYSFDIQYRVRSCAMIFAPAEPKDSLFPV